MPPLKPTPPSLDLFGEPEPTAAGDAALVESVFDSLCIAGSARGKTWVLHFLRGMETRTLRGAYPTLAEIDAALQHLLAAGRITTEQGIGFGVPRQPL
ncbi:MAG: hypothetical protein Q8L92_15410, partial [Rubrivivax sp.]|nr:hypothetical protein [Rubrivivax sp.]